MYVANSGSSTVSVINPTTNNVIKNIPVGNPDFYSQPIHTWRCHVRSKLEFSNTVSVINPTTNTVIKNITVGDNPTFISTFGDAVYVANSGSNTVSVINPST